MNAYKKIGIIGGLSPESTVSYYLHITRSYFKKFGTHSYPEIIIYSVNLENYHQWRSEDRWDLIAEDLVKAANFLLLAGAQLGLIATNTMHKVFEIVQVGTNLPLINIIDITANYAKERKLKKLALLGTSYTMSQSFYKAGLASHGLSVVVPSPEDQAILHRIIVEELVCGEIKEVSTFLYLEIINKMQKQGAEAIILGCTEIPLLITQKDCELPLIDTAKIHAEAAFQLAVNS